MSDLVSAKQAEERLQTAWTDAKRCWWVLASAAKDFRDGKHWKPLGYKGWKEYLSSTGWGASTIQNMITLYEAHAGKEGNSLPAGMELVTEKVAKMMLWIPKSKRYEPPVLEMAQSVSGSKFYHFCKEGPYGAYIPTEHKRPWVINLPDSLREKLEEAIELAKSLQETESDEIGLEMIIAHFLECEEIRKLAEA